MIQFIDTYNQETKEIDSSLHEDRICSIQKKDEREGEKRKRERERERERGGRARGGREGEGEGEREREREREIERFTPSDCQNKQLRDARASSYFCSWILASTAGITTLQLIFYFTGQQFSTFSFLLKLYMANVCLQIMLV